MARQRVQIYLDPNQRLKLAELAKARNESISEITHQAIEAGLAQMVQSDQHKHIKAALEAARQLRDSTPLLDIDVVTDIHQMREDRDNDLLCRG